MSEQNRPSSFIFSLSWRRLLLHSTIIGVGLLFGLLSWYISKPQATRFYETSSEQRQKINVTPHFEITLDKETAVAITENQPIEVELFKGNAYFYMREKGISELEVKVAKALIRNVGTRFYFSMHTDSSCCNVAVDEGQIEVSVKSGTYLVNAGEQVDFDGADVYMHKLIFGTDIEPWHVD